MDENTRTPANVCGSFSRWTDALEGPLAAMADALSDGETRGRGKEKKGKWPFKQKAAQLFS